MTREEAIQFLDNMKHEEAGRAIGKDGFYAELMGYHVEALNIAIKALEHPERNVVAIVPCGDAISRKAVINQIFYSTDNNGDVVLGSALRERIASLPSVTPQEPTLAQERYEDLCEYFGDAKDILNSREDFKAWLDRVKWHIHKAEELYKKYEQELDLCEYFGDATPQDNHMDFCPHCGAKMIDVPDTNIGKMTEIPTGSGLQESEG